MPKVLRSSSLLPKTKKKGTRKKQGGGEPKMAKDEKEGYMVRITSDTD